MSKVYNISLSSNFFEELSKIILKEKDVQKIILPNNRSCRMIKDELIKVNCIAPEIVSISEIFNFPDIRFMLLNFLRRNTSTIPFNTLFDLAESLSVLIRNLIINKADYRDLIIPDQFSNDWGRTVVILDKIFENPEIIELKNFLETTWNEYLSSLDGEKIAIIGLLEENFYSRSLYLKALDSGFVVVSGLEIESGDNYEKIKQLFSDRWDQLETEYIGQRAKEKEENRQLIEVMNNSDEALVIALIARDQLEQDKNVLIVSSNLSLTQKIKIELLKWNIFVDDSSGVALNHTVCGQIISQIILMIEHGFSNVDVVNFLKFKSFIKKDVLYLENILRKKENYPLGFFSTFETFLSEEKEKKKKEEQNKLEKIIKEKPKKSKNASQCVFAFMESDGEIQDDIYGEGGSKLLQKDSDAKNFLEESVSEASLENIVDMVEKLKSFSVYPKNADFNFWLGYFVDFISLVSKTAAEEFLESMDSQDCESISLLEFCVFLKNHFFNEYVRQEKSYTSGIKILGILESQLVDADMVIISGANEESWKASNANDFWMSDSMLRQLNINTVDSRNGVYSCVWEKLINKKNVIVTRSYLEQGEQAQKYNRLLNANLKEDVKYKELLKKVKTPSDYTKIEFKDPSPSVEYRPTIFWVSDLDLLINNPYVYYAKKVLKLKEVGQINERINLRGKLVHRVLDEFVKKHISDNELLNLKQIFKQVCRESFINLDVLGLWYFRVDPILKFFLKNFNKDAKSFSEIEGHMDLELSEKKIPIRIASIADRIEVDPSGKVFVIDYKTGTIPEIKKVRNCEKIQLPVESLIASVDGFRIGATKVENMSFWPMKSKASKITVVSETEQKTKEICDKVLQAVEDLLMRYIVNQEPYKVNFNDIYNKQYMQLSRYKEILL